MDLENETNTQEEVTTPEVEIAYFPVTPLFKGADGKWYGFYCVNRPEDVEGLYTYFANMLGVLGVDAHLVNTSIHVSETDKTTWAEAAATAAAVQVDVTTLLSTVSNLESKVENVMDGLYSDISTNPWAVTFKDLDDITLDGGLWNEEKGRIEW